MLEKVKTEILIFILFLNISLGEHPAAMHHGGSLNTKKLFDYFHPFVGGFGGFLWILGDMGYIRGVL